MTPPPPPSEEILEGGRTDQDIGAGHGDGDEGGGGGGGDGGGGGCLAVDVGAAPGGWTSFLANLHTGHKQVRGSNPGEIPD